MIYLLEDDENIRKLVLYTFNSQGIESMGFMKTSEASRFKALICFIVSITFYDRLFCQQNERTGITHSSVDGNHCPANSCSRSLGEFLQFADKY